MLKFVIKAISLIEVEKRIIRWQMMSGNNENSRMKGQAPETDLYWSGTIAEFVEFGYGLHELKAFNDGDIDISDLISKLGNLFSIEVKDCYDTFRAIRRRVDSRTLFLDEMKEKLNSRMDDMDNGIFKKKKNRNKKND